MTKKKSHLVAKSIRSHQSSFIRHSVKRSAALVTTSGLVIGLGVAGATPAIAEEPFTCDVTNTAYPASTPAASKQAILDVLDDHTDICLDGDFTIDGPIMYDANLRVYGVEDSSIESVDGHFVSSGLFNIDIFNLTITGASNAVAVSGAAVNIIDSTFTNNSQGAVRADFSVEVFNSTFVNNSTAFGGAVYVDGSDEQDYALVVNSTFVGNGAIVGGAILAYAVIVENSTFVDNEASGDNAEGGAIYANYGEIIFSTFVNNVAPDPVAEEDVPGNAIYKWGSAPFSITASIFAGDSPHPQLGIGEAPTPFTDGRGNIFSNASSIELDIAQDDSSVYGASLSSIFGTDSPELASYAPNTNGTQTIALGPGSPALDIVDEEDLNGSGITQDQRGASRTHPADAGAYEGFVTPSLATTGSTTQWWAVWSSAAMLAIGGLVVTYGTRTSRRKI